jgi:hypothetical protein
MPFPVLILMVVIAGAHSVAEAYFFGVVEADKEVLVNVDNTQNVGVSTAATITFLNASGTRIKAMENFTVAPGGSVSHTTTVPRKSSRVFVDVYPARGATVLVDIRQGASTFSDMLTGDGRLVLDVAPAP